MDKFFFKLLLRIKQECGHSCVLLFQLLHERLSTGLSTDTLETRANLQLLTNEQMHLLTNEKDDLSTIGVVDKSNGVNWLKVTPRELALALQEGESTVRRNVDKLCISGFLKRGKLDKSSWDQQVYYALGELSLCDALKPAENSSCSKVSNSICSEMSNSLYITNLKKNIDITSLGLVSSDSTISADDHYSLVDEQAKAEQMSTEQNPKPEPIKKTLNQARNLSGPEDDMVRVWNEHLGWKKRLALWQDVEETFRNARLNHFPTIEGWTEFCRLINTSRRLTAMGFKLSCHWICKPEIIAQILRGEWGVELPGAVQGSTSQRALTGEYSSSDGYSNLPEGHPEGYGARMSRQIAAEAEAKYRQDLIDQGLAYMEPEELFPLQEAVPGGFKPREPWGPQLARARENQARMAAEAAALVKSVTKSLIPPKKQSTWNHRNSFENNKDALLARCRDETIH